MRFFVVGLFILQSFSSSREVSGKVATLIAASRLKREYTPLSSSCLAAFTEAALEKFGVSHELRHGIVSRVLAVQSVAQIHKTLHTCIQSKWPYILPCFKKVGENIVSLLSSVVTAYGSVTGFNSTAIKDTISLLEKYWNALKDGIRVRGRHYPYSELRSSLYCFFFDGIPRFWSFFDTVDDLVHSLRRRVSIENATDAMKLISINLPYSSELLVIARSQKVKRARQLELSLRRCVLSLVISSTRTSMHADLLVETVRMQLSFFEKVKAALLNDSEKALSPFIQKVPRLTQLLSERDSAISGTASLEFEIHELEDCYTTLCRQGLVCSPRETSVIHDKLEQFLGLLLKLQRRRAFAIRVLAGVVVKLF